MRSIAEVESWKESLYVRQEGVREFWSDAVKRLKREKRYADAAEICRQQIPLPAAFRDLMVSLRALIRQKRKAKATCEDLLRELFEVAVYGDVLTRFPYVELARPILGEKSVRGYPGYGIAEIAHRNGARSRMRFDYEQIGYRNVTWLGASDRKWLLEAWGEPKRHSDPFEQFQPDWLRALDEFARALESQEKRSQQEWQDLIRAAPAERRRRWWWPFG